MDPTLLPTDNLYKFMALAGLAVAFFAVYMGVQARYRVDDRTTQRQIEVAQLEITGGTVVADFERLRDEQTRRIAEADERYERFNTKWNELVELDQAKKLTPAARKAAHDEFMRDLERSRASRRDLTPKLEELLDRNRKLAGDVAKVEIEATVDKRLLSEQGVIAWLTGLSIFAGLSLSAAGFRLWYERLQKYLDAAVAKGTSSPST